MKKNAFSLVELLVVIAVLSLAGFLVLNIFTNALRGSNKSQILSSIKKNGQAVLEIMDKSIRNADNVVCIAESRTSLVIVKDGIYTRYRFKAQSTEYNGQIQQDNPERQTFGSPPREETDAQFINRVCGESGIMPEQFNILTDIDSQTGVSVQNGSFTRGRQAGFKDTVTIRFQVTYPIHVSPALAGQIDPVEFATTVGLR